MLTVFIALSLASPAQLPSIWSCEFSLFGDGICDCGCGAQDSDCASLEFSVCERSSCSADEAPWEHTNSACMAAACGDGWKSGNEACDDGDRVASGGCSADCSAVSDGFECGEAFHGCTETADESGGEGEGEGEGAGGADNQRSDDQSREDASGSAGGCGAVPAVLPAALLGFLPFRRRARR